MEKGRTLPGTRAGAFVRGSLLAQNVKTKKEDSKYVSKKKGSYSGKVPKEPKDLLPNERHSLRQEKG